MWAMASHFHCLLLGSAHKMNKIQPNDATHTTTHTVAFCKSQNKYKYYGNYTVQQCTKLLTSCKPNGKTCMKIENYVQNALSGKQQWKTKGSSSNNNSRMCECVCEPFVCVCVCCHAWALSTQWSATAATVCVSVCVWELPLAATQATRDMPLHIVNLVENIFVLPGFPLCSSCHATSAATAAALWLQVARLLCGTCLHSLFASV